MAKNPAPIPTEQLVEALWQRHREKLAAEKDIAEISAVLIERGAGKHTGHEPEHVITVVAAGEPGVKFSDVTGDTVDAVKEIAGAAWSELFERVVVLKPKKAFEERADALLNAAPKAKLFALVSKPTAARSAYILGLPKG